MLVFPAHQLEDGSRENDSRHQCCDDREIAQPLPEHIGGPADRRRGDDLPDPCLPVALDVPLDQVESEECEELPHQDGGHAADGGRGVNGSRWPHGKVGVEDCLLVGEKEVREEHREQQHDEEAVAPHPLQEVGAHCGKQRAHLLYHEGLPSALT
jgi:hypothetical protein